MTCKSACTFSESLLLVTRRNKSSPVAVAVNSSRLNPGVCGPVKSPTGAPEASSSSTVPSPPD